MGNVMDTLYWQKEASDGSERSIVSIILDPVGVCLQPTDLKPWNLEDALEADTSANEEPASIVQG